MTAIPAGHCPPNAATIAKKHAAHSICIAAETSGRLGTGSRGASTDPKPNSAAPPSATPIASGFPLEPPCGSRRMTSSTMPSARPATASSGIPRRSITAASSAAQIGIVPASRPRAPITYCSAKKTAVAGTEQQHRKQQRREPLPRSERIGGRSPRGAANAKSSAPASPQRIVNSGNAGSDSSPSSIPRSSNPRCNRKLRGRDRRTLSLLHAAIAASSRAVAP